MSTQGTLSIATAGCGLSRSGHGSCRLPTATNSSGGVAACEGLGSNLSSSRHPGVRRNPITSLAIRSGHEFDRAQVHRQEAEAMIAVATVEQAIRIEKTQTEGGVWDYTVHHDATIDPAFPAVVGDFLFNLRSALDHIAAANRRKPTWKTPFPLFHDPISSPAVQGEPSRYQSYRKTWEQVRANTPPAVFKLMDDAQPFNAPAGLVPADTALAVLNELQNRDKHASLAVVTSGIKDIECWVEVPDGRRSIRDPNLPPACFRTAPTFSITTKTSTFDAVAELP